MTLSFDTGFAGLPGVEIVGPKGRIDMPPPTVWKPRKLWTGKQVSITLHYTYL